MLNQTNVRNDAGNGQQKSKLFNEFKMGVLFFSGLVLLLIAACASAEPTPVPEPTATPTATLTPTPTATPTPTPDPRPVPQAGPDSDHDWVSDADEEKFGTDKFSVDTDGDRYSDFEEIFMMLGDPTVAREPLTEAERAEIEDRDFDGLPDDFEIKNGSDPGKLDTDGDLLSDYVEFYLTETDPATADPISPSGFPEPLLAWLPTPLQDASCAFQIETVIDSLTIVDPEEADGDNLQGGDEIVLNYGLWVDVSEPDNTLQYVWDENPSHSQQWRGDGYRGDIFDNFLPLQPITASCGQTLTFALQVLESDLPWGGVRDFGVWLEHLPLLFQTIPPQWALSYPREMYYEGTGGDSANYRYELEYSLTVETDN